jgi:hypothetical protein
MVQLKVRGQLLPAYIYIIADAPVEINIES